MSDPYKVLGVSRDASDDEIKKAYRQLSRKYHPDANINNPNKEKAEEMFKLVQQAYDQIMDQRKNGASSAYGYGGYGNSGGYGSGGFGGFEGWGDFGGFGQSRANESQSDAYLRAASNYINNRHFTEALNVLSQVEERSSRWYYYSAIANNGVGNNIIALDHARTALQMEPNNYNYQRLVQTLESGGQWYSSQQETFGGMNTSYCCSNPCLTCCILNSLCNCFC